MAAATSVFIEFLKEKKTVTRAYKGPLFKLLPYPLTIFFVLFVSTTVASVWLTRQCLDDLREREFQVFSLPSHTPAE